MIVVDAYGRVSMTSTVRVRRVTCPRGQCSWTVVDGAGAVEPVDRFLGYLSAIERSPNTVRSYAHDLRDFVEFLQCRHLQWDAVRLEDLGRYVEWLRLPPAGRDGIVAALPSAAAALTVASVNRKLSALASFYEFHRRHGVTVAGLMIGHQRGEGLGTSWRPFLCHLGGDRRPRRTVGMRAERRIPREVSAAEFEALLEASDRQRDRFLLVLLRRSGLRIGEALGLRHEDLDPMRGQLVVRPRENTNGARAKSYTRFVPLDSGVFRAYSDYLHTEYGALDSDYVFVNLWGEPRGAAMGYPSVARLVRRLRARTGIAFSPHHLRHSYATGLEQQRNGQWR